MKILFQWMKANSILLINAGSLIGTSAVTSILGFVYWWVAARQFPLEAVGIASASVAAMTLLGGFCVLGLGTLLITELPRQPGHESELISTALIVVGGVGGCVGMVFALVASYISPSFKPLGANILDVVIFASGVSLMAITLVLDQALIGLLRGELQFWRNVLLAVIKLVALFVASLLFPGKEGITIYATWAMGNILSLMALSVLLLKNGRTGRKYLPQWGLLGKLGAAALQHHLLNLTLQAPVLILPMLVTALLSSTMNAWYYVAWMIANFLFLIPNMLTMVLHAMNSAQQSTLARKARVTIGLALVTGLLVNCLLQLAAKQVLGLFGGSYADQATYCLRVLLLAIFPLTIKNHYISICRIYDRLVRAMLGMLPGGLLELSAAALGAHVGGLAGLSIGWVAAIYVEAVFMFPTVYKTIRYAEVAVGPIEQRSPEVESIWLVETSPLPVMGQSYGGTASIWLIETFSMPMLRLPDRRHANMGPGTPKKSLWQYETDRHSSSDRHSLKPPQLQQDNPCLRGECTTDPSTAGQFFERMRDSSTI